VPPDEDDAYRRLAAEAGLPFVTLDEALPVHADIASLVPAELARRYRIVPLAATADALRVASARPGESAVVTVLEAFTRRSVELVVSSARQIDAVLDRTYGPVPLLRAGRFRPPAVRATDEPGARLKLESSAAALLGERLCRRLRVAPLSASGGELVVAVERPLPPAELRLLEAASAHRIVTVLASPSRIAEALDALFASPRRSLRPGVSNGRMHEPGDRLGELLVRTGAISPETLRNALAEQRRTGDPLGQVLRARRAISDELLASTIATQLRLPYVEGGDLVPAREAMELLPETVCRRHLILPVAVIDDDLVVAMADPLAIDATRALRETSPLPVRIVVAGSDAIRSQLDSYYAAHYVDVSTTQLLHRRPDESAFHTLSPAQKVAAVGLLGALALGLAVAWQATMIALIIASIAFYFATAVFKFALVYHTMRADSPEVPVSDNEIALLDESALPTYTILVPLYHEHTIAEQLIEALQKLDYPTTKLDVKLLLEEDDPFTLAAVRRTRLPAHFHVVIVPYAEPRTKPKACNYGLLHARGEVVVIYDAEDIPDPLQLKKAVVAMRKSAANVVCVQAKLNYWNREQNLLTRWFTAEYSQWFDLFLPGLDAIGGPIPLGGTSNHFRVDVLLELGAWDPFNVTEDADVGIRLVRHGYRTSVIDSTTYEEANCRVYNWLRQRSRWIKGYIQTWLVHMRHPVRLWRELGTTRFISFQLVIAGTFTTMLLNPLFWGLTSLWAATKAGWIRELFPGPVYFLGGVNLLVGNFIFTFLNVVGAWRRGYHELVRAALFSPLYWALMSVGAWRGLIQLFTRASYWEKTVHGLAERP
jgi:cellulose synthase/poly-beta-1,6-N-acetylglucosamine synthase-like glycosyltransferase